MFLVINYGQEMKGVVGGYRVARYGGMAGVTYY
jgi:hypothetical protein